MIEIQGTDMDKNLIICQSRPKNGGQTMSTYLNLIEQSMISGGCWPDEAIILYILFIINVLMYLKSSKRVFRLKYPF